MPPQEAPFYFEHKGTPLYAMLHVPHSATETGVVMCPPLADEAFRAHREFVVFSRLLAGRGVATLRFDYRGTGDSGGAFEDYGVADWADDIVAAVAELRRRTSVKDVVLLGLRTGASLAAAVASTTDAATRLVLWAPVPPARFLSDLEKAALMHQLANHGKVTSRTPFAERLRNGDEPDLAGYTLTQSLYDGLSTLDPWAMTARCPTLIAGIRGDTTKPDELAALQRNFSDSEVIEADVKRFWFQKVFQNPAALFDATAEWINLDQKPASRLQEAPLVIPPPTADAIRGEVPVVIRDDSLRIYGTVHTPDDQNARRGVILFHGGRQARRGPHRFYTKIARRLCASGFHVLRYESRGYGESTGPETATFDDWIDDARHATDYFREQHRIEELWGWGLCGGSLLATCSASGRPDAFAGFVFCNALFDADYITPHGTPRKTPAARLNRDLLRKAATSPGHYFRRASAKMWRKIAGPLGNGSLPASFDQGVKRHIARFPRMLADLAKPTLFIFGDAAPHMRDYQAKVFDHPAIARWSLNEGPDLKVIPGGDHNFANLAHEREVIETTDQWLSSQIRESAWR